MCEVAYESAEMKAGNALCSRFDVVEGDMFYESFE